MKAERPLYKPGDVLAHISEQQAQFFHERFGENWQLVLAQQHRREMAALHHQRESSGWRDKPPSIQDRQQKYTDPMPINRTQTLRSVSTYSVLSKKIQDEKTSRSQDRQREISFSRYSIYPATFKSEPTCAGTIRENEKPD